jgi:hypothetical protein
MENDKMKVVVTTLTETPEGMMRIAKCPYCGKVMRTEDGLWEADQAAQSCPHYQGLDHGTDHDIDALFARDPE